jgi:hypothetical protein
MERPKLQEDKKNHLRGQTTKGTSIKFLNPLLLRETYKIRKGKDLLKG